MKRIKNTKLLVAALLLPLAVGGLAALLSGDGFREFEALRKPPLSPPAWLFPVVWTVLYLLMGLASYLVAVAEISPERKKRALLLYAAQLAVNFLWPLFFFAWELPGAALAVLVVLWLLAAACAVLFWHIDPRAGRLLLPYLLWLSFALYLNAGVVLLN